jgi:hypothetical protein
MLTILACISLFLDYPADEGKKPFQNVGHYQSINQLINRQEFLFIRRYFQMRYISCGYELGDSF